MDFSVHLNKFSITADILNRYQKGKWYHWKRLLAIESEDGFVAIVSLNCFQRLARLFLQILGVNYFKKIFAEKKVRVLNAEEFSSTDQKVADQAEEYFENSPLKKIQNYLQKLSTYNIENGLPDEERGIIISVISHIQENYNETSFGKALFVNSVNIFPEGNHKKVVDSLVLKGIISEWNISEQNGLIIRILPNDDLNGLNAHWLEWRNLGLIQQEKCFNAYHKISLKEKDRAELEKMFEEELENTLTSLNYRGKEGKCVTIAKEDILIELKARGYIFHFDTNISFSELSSPLLCDIFVNRKDKKLADK